MPKLAARARALKFSRTPKCVGTAVDSGDQLRPATGGCEERRRAGEWSCAAAALDATVVEYTDVLACVQLRACEYSGGTRGRAQAAAEEEARDKSAQRCNHRDESLTSLRDRM